MNLKQLQTDVTNATRAAFEHGERPENVNVSLQIDDPDNPNSGYVCADHGVTLHYDGNTNASGCVLQAWKEYGQVER